MKADQQHAGGGAAGLSGPQLTPGCCTAGQLRPCRARAGDAHICQRSRLVLMSGAM